MPVRSLPCACMCVRQPSPAQDQERPGREGERRRWKRRTTRAAAGHPPAAGTACTAPCPPAGRRRRGRPAAGRWRGPTPGGRARAAGSGHAGVDGGRRGRVEPGRGQAHIPACTAHRGTQAQDCLLPTMHAIITQHATANVRPHTPRRATPPVRWPPSAPTPLTSVSMPLRMPKNLERCCGPAGRGAGRACVPIPSTPSIWIIQARGAAPDRNAAAP